MRRVQVGASADARPRSVDGRTLHFRSADSDIRLDARFVVRAMADSKNHNLFSGFDTTKLGWPRATLGSAENSDVSSSYKRYWMGRARAHEAGIH